MAGQPRRQALAAELLKLARAEFDGREDVNAADYVVRCVESGETPNKIAIRLTKALGWEVTRASLMRYVELVAPDIEERIRRARLTGAHALAEKSVDITEDAAPQASGIVSAQARSMQWLAGRWNREELGERPAASVTLNLGALMLEALQAPPPPRPAIARVIAEDAVDVSVEEPKS